MKRLVSISATLAAVLFLTTPAWAPFHLMVIEQVFFGTDNLPQAQYVMLRTLASGQVFVSDQQFPMQNADGSDAGLFGKFTKSFTRHPQPDVAILAGTQAAQDLLCLPMDQIVAGSLVYPDGRVCFGLFNYNDGRGDRPVDCVAYGAFSGTNEPYLPPAMAPQRSLALVRINETDNNQDDFMLLAPMPQNNNGDVGQIDGKPGDVDGTGMVTAEDVDNLAHVLFAAGRRCDITDPAQRGADANVDTRIGAADLIATADALVIRGG